MRRKCGGVNDGKGYIGFAGVMVMIVVSMRLVVMIRMRMAVVMMMIVVCGDKGDNWWFLVDHADNEEVVNIMVGGYYVRESK